METKQNPPVGLPTFNDPGRYGEQIITQGQFPDGSGMSSGGGGTEIQSFDFPTPDTTTGTPKPVNPAKKARQEGKTVRKNIRQNSRAKDIELNNFKKEQKLRQRKGEMLPVGLSSSGLATKTTLPSADVLTESPFDMMGQQYDQQSPQGTVPMQNLMPDQTAMSYQPPMPGNVQGNAQPVFNPSATNAAQQIYGSQEQRQQSVPGAPLYMHHDTVSSLGTFAAEIASTRAASTGASKAMFAQFGSSLGIGGGVKSSGRLKRKEEKLKKTAKQLASNEIGMKDWSRKLKKYNKTKNQIN